MSSLAPKVGPLGLSPKAVGEAVAAPTHDWKFYKVDVELHLRQPGGGRWYQLAKVVVVPSTSLLVRRAFHGNNEGRWHAGQHGPPHNGKPACGQGGGLISFVEVVEIAKVVRARELERHRLHMTGLEEPGGRRRRTAPCLAKDLRGTVKEVLGVIYSMHGLVDGERADHWVARLDGDQALIERVRQEEEELSNE